MLHNLTKYFIFHVSCKGHFHIQGLVQLFNGIMFQTQPHVAHLKCIEQLCQLMKQEIQYAKNKSYIIN